MEHLLQFKDVVKSKEAVDKLKKWYGKHELRIKSVYTSKEEKAQMTLTTKLTKKQIDNDLGMKVKRI